MLWLVLSFMLMKFETPFHMSDCHNNNIYWLKYLDWNIRLIGRICTDEETNAIETGDHFGPMNKWSWNEISMDLRGTRLVESFGVSTLSRAQWCMRHLSLALIETSFESHIVIPWLGKCRCNWQDYCMGHGWTKNETEDRGKLRTWWHRSALIAPNTRWVNFRACSAKEAHENTIFLNTWIHEAPFSDQ